MWWCARAASCGQVGDREHLMVIGHAAQGLTDHQPDPSADPGVHLVEDQRGHTVEPGEDRLQREHHARQLAAGGDTRQGTRIVPDVERHLELDVLRAVRTRLVARRERHAEASVGHAEVREHLFDRAGQALGRRLPHRGERGGRLDEPLPRMGLARVERLQVDAGRIDEIELLARLPAGLDHLGQPGPVLLAQPEDQIPAALHLGEAVGIELHGALVLDQLARQLLERVEAVVVELLQA
jgi:hypothetical protein